MNIFVYRERERQREIERKDKQTVDIAINAELAA